MDLHCHQIESEKNQVPILIPSPSKSKTSHRLTWTVMSSSAPGGSGPSGDKPQGFSKFIRRASRVLKRSSSSKAGVSGATEGAPSTSRSTAPAESSSAPLARYVIGLPRVQRPMRKAIANGFSALRLLTSQPNQKQKRLRLYPPRFSNLPRIPSQAAPSKMPDLRPVRPPAVRFRRKRHAPCLPSTD